MKVSNQRGEVVALFRGKSASIAGNRGARGWVPNKKSFPALEPIERPASTNYAACSSSGWCATLRHAYAHLPVYPAPVRRGGRAPDDCHTLRTWPGSLHHQEGSARQLPVWHVCRATSSARASTLPAAPPASRPWSGWHAEGHRHLGRCDGAASALCRCPPRRPGAPDTATAVFTGGLGRTTAQSGWA